MSEHHAFERGWRREQHGQDTAGGGGQESRRGFAQARLSPFGHHGAGPRGQIDELESSVRCRLHPWCLEAARLEPHERARGRGLAVALQDDAGDERAQAERDGPRHRARAHAGHQDRSVRSGHHRELVAIRGRFGRPEHAVRARDDRPRRRCDFGISTSARTERPDGHGGAGDGGAGRAHHLARDALRARQRVLAEVVALGGVIGPADPRRHHSTALGAQAHGGPARGGYGHGEGAVRPRRGRGERFRRLAAPRQPAGLDVGRFVRDRTDGHAGRGTVAEQQAAADLARVRAPAHGQAHGQDDGDLEDTSHGRHPATWYTAHIGLDRAKCLRG